MCARVCVWGGGGICVCVHACTSTQACVRVCAHGYRQEKFTVTHKQQSNGCYSSKFVLFSIRAYLSHTSLARSIVH